MSAVLDSQPTVTTDGVFSSDAFASHLAGIGHLPAWWLDLKRAAWDRFVALPLPARTDELWRFSTVAGIKFDGCTIADATALGFSPPRAAYPCTATLALFNNRPFAGEALPPELEKLGVVFCSIEEAIVNHAELFRRHFMAQPVNLGSEKFAALNAALTRSGAFLYVPRGVEVEAPFLVHHMASGNGAAVFPHTIAILEDTAKATLVENFRSADPPPPASPQA